MTVDSEYLAKRDETSRLARRREFEGWLNSIPQEGDEGKVPSTKGAAEGTVDKALGIAKDIGGGVVEAPAQIMGGLNEAVVNAVKMADPLVEWLEKNVAELPRYEIPDVEAAKTVTGGVIREGARFLTGFVPAFRALKGLGPVTATMGGGAISDAVTANPASGGISNLVNSVPSLKNPVTEYLATDPDDPEALNRLRKGIEGAGFGVLAEGVFRGVKALAKAKAVPKDALEEARALYGSVKTEDFAILGDPAKPPVTFQKAVKATKATKDVEPQLLTEVGEAGGEKVFVNWARMNTEDDVKNVMKKMVDTFAKDIDQARRGVRTHEMTEKAAEELGMSVGDLMARRKGQAFNAEELMASTKLWAASGQKLLEVARKAASPNAGVVDQYNFRKMMAIHYAIQSEAIGARAEAGRALNILGKITGGGVEQARAIQQVIDSQGGAAVSQEMARRLALLGEVTPAALNGVVRKGWAATSMDMVRESFVNGLLWSPATHAVNITSNLAFATQQIFERGVASGFAELAGRAAGEGVHSGEALAMAYGLVSGLRDAFRSAGRALKTGEQTQLKGKIDLPPEPAISTQSVARERGMSASELDAFQQSNLGKAVDYLGTAVRVPGRLLITEDEFFKSIGYRMELHAQSLRMAAGEGKTGPDLYKRMAEIANDPPESVRLAAADAALYNTFQNEAGKIAKSLMEIRHAGTFNPTVLFLPFVRTPANLFYRAFERTPLAPFMESVRADFAAGGARADLAAARIATGSTVLAVVGDLAYSGLISGAGPDDPGEREALERQGWQKFSIRVGDKWVQYGRLDPMGLLFSFSASMAEFTKRFDLEPEELDEVAGAAVGAVSKSVISRTYLEGLSRVVDAVASGDQSPRQVAKILEDTAASLVPFSSALMVGKRLTDPEQREADSVWEAIQARIAGLSKNLKPARDLWGQVKKPDEVYGRLVDVITPAAIRKEKDSPIDAEIARLNADVRRIQPKGDFQGVPMNLRHFKDVKDEYERLAGNELKINGYGAKDLLDAVVTGQHPLSSVYQTLPDTEEGKGNFIKDVVNRYRTAARAKILNDPRFSDFREAWDQGRIELMRKRVP